MLKKIVFFFFLVVVLFILTSVFADFALACLTSGSRCDNSSDVCCAGSTCTPAGPPGQSFCTAPYNPAPSTFFGKISPPPGIASYAGGTVQGIVLFANNILKLIITIGGVLTFLNILFAGVTFITAAGDPKKIEQAWTKIWQSVLGLAIIAGSFVIAAIIGWILFGDATAILSPNVYGPGQP